MKSFFEFSDREIFEAAAADRLLSLELEFTRACNYRCPYCYVPDEADPSRSEMTEDTIRGVIGQAAGLGARKIVILGGEPLLYDGLERMLEYIQELGMRSEIFTNGALVTPEVAEMLRKYRPRVVVKFNSLDPAVQERMTGEPHALDKVKNAIAALTAAGFAHQGLIAASTVICSENADGLFDLWKYLRDNDIIPYFEMLTPQGRLNENRHLLVDFATTRRLFERIEAYDRSIGLEWESQPPLVGGKCLRHLHSCAVNSYGDVTPCVGVNCLIGNVHDRPLKEILLSSSVMNDFKEFRNRIKSPCAECAKSDSCYGCRGAAYQLTGDYLAADPMCWLNADKLEQIKTLPCKVSGDMLPHRKPMLMADEIVEIGQSVTVACDITADNLFVDRETGLFSRVAIPELAAQSAAAAGGMRNRCRAGGGFLVGVKMRCRGDLKAGDRALVTVTDRIALEEWHYVDFSVRTAGKLVAEGEIKLCIID